MNTNPPSSADPNPPRDPGDPRHWITPFAWEDEAGDLHLCCDRVCEEMGWPITEENLRIAEQGLIEMMRKAQPGGLIISHIEEDIARWKAGT